MVYKFYTIKFNKKLYINILQTYLGKYATTAEL